MKKTLFTILFLWISIGNIYAIPSNAGSISENDTATVTSVAGHHCFIENDGANEVYIQFEIDSDDGAAASTADYQLKNGEDLKLDSDRKFVQFLSICSAGETATIRYICWD